MRFRPSRLLRLPGRAHTAQAARFGAVGLAATAVHYAALVIWVDGAGLAPAPANGLAFLVALCVTYLGQSAWVFAQAAPAPRAARLVRFCAAAGTGFLANAAVMALAVDAAGLPYRAGFALGLLMVPPLSFLLARSWVFASHVRAG